MTDFIVRKASIEDTNIIYHNLKLCSENMLKEQGLEHWIPVYSIESIEKDINEKNVFIVEYKEKIIGNFTVYSGLNDLWKDNWFYEKSINNIYVSKLCIIPEYSKHGFGKMCMQYIEEFCLNNKYNCICLDVYDKAIHAINFYKKIGYEIIGNASTRRFNVLLMKKDLNNE